MSELVVGIVHSALHHVPKMFQIFACKQIFDISANFHFYNKRDKSISPMCPSCTIARKTAGHILRCGEEGRVNALHKFSENIMLWMVTVGMDRDLIFLIGKFIQGRGHQSMEDICIEHELPSIFLPFARSQDIIGWRRFVEGMVSRELNLRASRGTVLADCELSVDVWMRELIVKRWKSLTVCGYIGTW
jgi:hypothetical protein